MKIQIPFVQEKGATLLLVTIVTTGLVGFALAAYLMMMSTQNRTTIASMAWNTSMAVVEAGIEDGMAHINKNGLENLASDGWAGSPSAGYTVTRYLGNNYYVVTISNVASVPIVPIIVSTGYVPTRLALWGGGPILATVNQNTAYTKRTVMVTALSESMFPSGLIAKDGVNWNGNIYTDSYDSTDPAYSTNRKWDMAKRKAGGSVGANNGNISMGGGVIYGSANTGPNGVVSGGTVGDLAWTSSSSGIQPGHYLNNMNYSFSDVKPPFGTNDVVFTTEPPGGGLATYATNSIITTNNTAGLLIIPSGAVAVFTNSATLSSVYPTGTPYPVYPTNICSGSFRSTNFITMISTNAVPIITTICYKQNGITVVACDHSSAKITISTTNWTTIVSSSQVPVYTTNAAACVTNFYHTSFTVAMSSTNQTYSTNSSGNYDAVYQDGNYQFSSWPGGNVLIMGNAKIYITGGLSMTGQEGITIAAGGSLNLYMGGNVKIGGNGVMNANADATKCAIWGLNTCAEIKVGGNAAYTGTIYAPHASLKGHGGGNDDFDMSGSAIVNSVTMNGHFVFHYDEALGRTGLADGFKISSWQEISSN